MAFRVKNILPRGLYGRALLILVVPIVTIQLVVSIAFIQRHFERVTQQMTGTVTDEIRYVLGRRGAGDVAGAAAVAQGLGLGLAPESAPMTGVTRDWLDLSGRVVAETLRLGVPGFLGADLTAADNLVRADFREGDEILRVTIDRRRMSATNPHQLLVLMIATSVLMTLISYLFLRNQVAPIRKLAEVAEAFGKGQHMPYRPRGATEVRAAGAAFLDMRARIERALESRTRMLSGVSHDLRTPLTRLKLGLSMLPEDEETQALLGDVADMERLVDEFLAFARGDATEEPEETDLAALVARLVENAARAGQRVELQGAMVVRLRLRPQAVTRALQNLLNNANRFGNRTRVTLLDGDRSVRIVVEDDGPGIPMERRDEAVQPFARLDGARDPNKGGGVGLGLSIAADIARSHGGALRLGESETLGGLRAELALAR
ncbi:ATP-binding protein [Gemmobacter caeruleus]|uniref:ATP-binding protein n=1 Tax=Gemmobacter caeruleus TaxID=2595004 RepID=UPI0011EF809E|nr:ATP-binding protein [Gemmobacter caeruleus]